MLRRLPGVKVVVEAENGHEALRLIKESRPTLVLTDIALLSLNGFEVLARITKEYPEVRVVMLSMYVRVLNLKILRHFCRSQPRQLKPIACS